MTEMRSCVMPLSLVLCDSLDVIFKYFKGFTKIQTNIITILNFNKKFQYSDDEY